MTTGNIFSEIEQVEYQQFVHINFQATGGLFEDATQLISGVTGSTVDFRVAGTIVAQPLVYGSPAPAQDPGLDKKTAVLEPFIARVVESKQGAFTTNVNARESVARQQAYALRRRSDQYAINALFASGTSNDIPAAGTGMTFDKLRQVNEFFNANNVLREDRHILLTAKADAELLNADEVTSMFYVQEKARQNGTFDKMMLMGMNFHVLGTMPEGGLGDGTKCFAWQREALGMAFAQDLEIEVKYEQYLQSYLIDGTLFGAATAVDNTGIVDINVVA